MSLAGFDSNDYAVESNLSFDGMLVPERMSQDPEYNFNILSPDESKLQNLDSNISLSSGGSSLTKSDRGYDLSEESSSEEEEENLGVEIGSALVDATSKIIKKYQKNRSTAMTDLQAGITMCVNHLNAVAAVLKSVDK